MATKRREKAQNASCVLSDVFRDFLCLFVADSGLMGGVLSRRSSRKHVWRVEKHAYVGVRRSHVTRRRSLPHGDFHRGVDVADEGEIRTI